MDAQIGTCWLEHLLGCYSMGVSKNYQIHLSRFKIVESDLRKAMTLDTDRDALWTSGEDQV